jgi:hypothetical protein
VVLQGRHKGDTGELQGCYMVTCLALCDIDLAAARSTVEHIESIEHIEHIGTSMNGVGGSQPELGTKHTPATKDSGSPKLRAARA